MQPFSATGDHFPVRALRDALVANEAHGGRDGRAPRRPARCGGGVALLAPLIRVWRCFALSVAVAVNETVAGLDVGGLNPQAYTRGAAVEARGQRGRRLDLGDQGLVGANRGTAVTEALRATRNTVHLVHHVVALHITPVQKFGPASGFGLF
eukprot:scaffold10959_cov60-Phaeocystis_antarctica.AAC.2